MAVKLAGAWFTGARFAVRNMERGAAHAFGQLLEEHDPFVEVWPMRVVGVPGWEKWAAWDGAAQLPSLMAQGLSGGDYWVALGHDTGCPCLGALEPTPEPQLQPCTCLTIHVVVHCVSP